MGRVPTLPRAGWLALGAVAGAMLSPAGSLAIPASATQVALVAATLALAGVVAGWRRRGSAAALLIGLGTVTLRGAVGAAIATVAVGPLELPVGSGEWLAQVTDLSSPAGMEQRAFVELEAGTDEPAGWSVYAWLPRHPALVPGDRLRVRGTVEAPPTDGSGFAGFLEARGALGTLKAHHVELLAPGSGFSAAIERLRWGLDGWLARAIPEPEAGLAAGILIGLRERVSRAVADDFITTGLTHVVAISGWNIALVAGIATALLRSTGLGRRPRNAIVIVAIVLYTLLAGAEASVIRAAVMGGVVIVARESGRPSGAAAALGLACWGLLLAQPAMIDDIGLQLSLAATAGLLALGGHAERLVRRLGGDRAPGWFCETLGVSLAAQLATLPLILLHFGRLSLISPLANLVVAPVVPMAMLGAALGVVIGPLVSVPFIGALTMPILLAAWLPLAAMTRGATLLAQVPFANVELARPLDLAGAAVALVGLVAALRRARQPTRSRDSTPHPAARPGLSPPARRRRPALLLSAVLIAASSAVLVARPHALLEVSVLDVGQGDAILLEASDGDRFLVDGGVDPDLLVRRLDERVPLWDRRIDLVILTHPHEDHSGGLAGLMPRYRIGAIAETGMRSDGAGVRELRSVAERHRVRRGRLVQGDELSLGPARVQVVWPPLAAIPEQAPTSGRVINNTSIVLSVTLRRQRILLTGDLEEDRELDLLEALPRDGGRWDLLKVAHHGSATATSAALLDVLRPRIAAVSSGIDNRYGHPADSTLGRLRDVGATVWRTDQAGSLSFSLDGRPRSASALIRGSRSAAPCPAIDVRPGQRRSRPGHEHHLGGSARTEASNPCYARPDGGPHSYRSALVAPVHLANAAPAQARDRGGRGGVTAGLSSHPGGRAGGPPPRRSSRAPP